MSEQNLEFVRGLYEGAEALDKEQLLESLPALIEQACDPEIEWFEDPQRADSRVYRGHEGVLQSFTQWLEGFDEYGFALDDLIDCGDSVFVIAREEGRGRASGAPVSSAIYQLLSFRNGKVLRFREFYDRNAALEAAGLSEADLTASERD
jgi:ketosteroid isomerase-like protein